MAEKTPASHRWGGPGASHEDRTEPEPVEKTGRNNAPDNDGRSHVSGGGGERDPHHSHDPRRK